MNTTFEKYLDTIDKCLKPLPTSERVDIVKEKALFQKWKAKTSQQNKF